MMAEKILGTLADKTILIIGAGKMSHLTIQQISSKPIKKLYIMNRTHERAVPIAEQYHANLASL